MADPSRGLSLATGVTARAGQLPISGSVADVGYSPITVGEIMTLPCVFQLDGGQPLNITGASLQLVFDPVPGSPSTNVRYVGAGSFQVTNAAGGLANYTTVAADTAGGIGYWLVYAVATFPGPAPRTSSPIEIEVVAAP